MKILLLGHKRHGKDTVAEMLLKHSGLTFNSSSQAAVDIFIYDALKDKYGYKTPEQCFEDRVNHRKEWYDLICGYNDKDKSALAKGILEQSNIYVGMRDFREIESCKEQGLFDFIIGVFDPRKELEGSDSFNIDIWKECDFVIPNGSSLENLENRVEILTQILK